MIFDVQILHHLSILNKLLKEIIMTLKAELRNQTGTSASKKARNEGKIPASMYGRDTEATSILINRREFEALLRKEGTNAVFDIDLDGTVQKVFLKDYDKAALADLFYSVDLEAISADQTLTVEIPLVLVGEENVKEGIVESVYNTIEVETKPDTIPNSFEMDVSEMEIGDTKTAADLDVPEGVEILLDTEETIVTVSAPTEEPEEVDPDAEMAQPEVIGESDEEEEE